MILIDYLLSERPGKSIPERIARNILTGGFTSGVQQQDAADAISAFLGHSVEIGEAVPKRTSEVLARVTADKGIEWWLYKPAGLHLGDAQQRPGIGQASWQAAYNQYNADGADKWQVISIAFPDLAERQSSDQDEKYWLTVEVNCPSCEVKREVFGWLKGGNLSFYAHRCHIQPQGRLKDDNRDENLWNHGR